MNKLGRNDDGVVATPKYAIGQQVWYIWTNHHWTIESCRIVGVQLEIECQEGDDVTVYHYGVSFGTASKSAFEVQECNLFLTREKAQALCDQWNSYPSESDAGAMG